MAGGAGALGEGAEERGGLGRGAGATASEEIEAKRDRYGDDGEGYAEQENHQRDLEEPGEHDEEEVAEDVERRGPTAVEAEGEIDVEPLPDREQGHPEDERAESED